MGNVRIELSNIRQLTGETTDIASMWEAYIRSILAEMETEGKKWLKARIKYANAELAKTVKKYQRMNADLKKQEKSSDWNRKQNKQRPKLDRQLKRQMDDKMKEGHKFEALDKEKNDLVKRIMSAVGTDKDKLVTEKNKVKEEIKVTKKNLESAEEEVGKTQRDILELTAAGVQQVLRNLQKDKQTLRRYSSLVSALQMPTI